MENSTKIHVILPSQRPDNIDAVVEEQDTCLLLGTEPVLRETKEDYATLVRKMEQQKPLIPGQVLVKNTIPVRFIAINYDIEKKPICCEAWIKLSLENIGKECKKRRILSLAMPLPGIQYGNISYDTAMSLLNETFSDERINYPEIIFVLYEH